MKTLGWGLIGCGDISRKRVAPAFRDLDICDLVAVSRFHAELAEPFAREFGARRWYPDWREVLADAEVEAVYIATPVHLHAPQTIAAAEAGRDVICEKPMALSAAECDRMLDACRANGVKLSIAYYRHFYPVIARIKHLLAAHEIGTPVLAQINAYEWFDMEPGSSRYWIFVRNTAGGGPMMDFGCHRIEVFLNLFGPISRTIGVACNAVFDRDVEDTAAALFQFESGPRGQLTVSTAVFESKDSLDIYGTKGSVHVPVLNEGSLTVMTAAGARTERHPQHPNAHLPYIRSVTEAFLEDRDPPVPGQTGREVARIVDDVYGRRPYDRRDP